MAKRPDPLALIADAVEEGTARSKHTRWMTRNYDELAELIDQGVPWTRVTAALVAADIVPENTRPSAMKRAWERVSARVAKTRARKPTAARPTPIATTAPRPPSPDPTPAGPPAESTGASKADEQIASLKELWRAQKSKMPDPL